MKNPIGWPSLVAMSLALVGCQEKVAEKAVVAAEAKPAVATANQDLLLHVDDEMMHNLKLETVREVTQPVVLNATGKLQFNEDEVSRVAAPVSGQVQQLTVRVGSEVKRGERLFFLNSREAAAAYTDYLEESKDLELAIKTQRMAKDLFDHQAGSRIAVEQAQRDVEKSGVRVARAEEALHILGLNPTAGGKLDPRIPVLATRPGTVIERKVTEGEYVQPEHDPLMIVSDLSTLWALADIFEHDMRHVHAGQRALVTTAAYPDRVFTAQVSYIAQVIDSDTRTVKVRFTVANPEHNLKPEMFASVRLFLNESEKSILIPSTCVISLGEKSYVYKMISKNEFSRIEVTAEAAESNRTRIRSGVGPGDEIVSSGTLLIRQLEVKK